MKFPFVVGALIAATVARADNFDWAGKVELDARGLTSDDPKQRLDAVHRLATDSIHLSLPFLLTALGDDDRSVRHEAAKALGLGRSTAAVPALIRWLTDPDPKTRAIAVEALGDIGGPIADQALTRSLGDSDPVVRQTAVKSLGKAALRGAPGVVASLLPRLADDKLQVRREAVDQLERIGDRSAVIPLVSRFTDPSNDVARAAVRAVGALGDNAAVPALIRMMNDSDENLQRLAAQALGQLGAVDAIDPMIDHLSRGNSDAFRSSVVHALGRIVSARGTGHSGESAMRVLVNELVSARIPIAAREALRAAGPYAVPALVAHLGARSKGDVSAIVVLLGEIGDARATTALIGELERGRVATTVVLRALATTRDPNALLAILSATSSSDDAIRLSAMQALRPFLRDDTRAGDVIAERLDDSNIDVRVLAAEYLGQLQVASPKLVAIAASDAPLRLRIAAIHALGEVAAKRELAEVPRVLVELLRTGPPELHAAVAAALSNAADPAALTSLISVASIRGPARHEVVRAIGAILRINAAPVGRNLLRALTADDDIKVATAAVGGLAAASHSDDTSTLRAQFERGQPALRRTAAWALGEVRDLGAIQLLIGALASPDDRLAGAAAWALGEIAIASPERSDAKSLTDRWLHVTRFGGWAAAINGMAALGRALWAHQPANRNVSTAQRDAMVRLAAHKSRLVRINAIFALSSLAGDTAAEHAITQRLRDDPSPHVRSAAAIGLGRMGTGRAALDASVRNDTDAGVVAAAKAGLNGPSAPLVRDQWRTFVVVNDQANDQPLNNQPYFVHGPDGLVWATYTDARGELTSEHVPDGTSAIHVWPADRESSY